MGILKDTQTDTKGDTSRQGQAQQKQWKQTSNILYINYKRKLCYKDINIRKYPKDISQKGNDMRFDGK